MASFEAEGKVAVLMVPFPAQGHLNQLLQLSCLLSSYSLPVFYIGSETHNRQAKTRANGIDSHHVSRIRFHDLPMPPFDSPPPNPDSDDKFPTQLFPSWYASLSLRKPFEAYLREMTHKYSRVVVVHDPGMSAVVQDVAVIENAESYSFSCVAAFFNAPFFLSALGKPFPENFLKLPNFDGLFSKEMTEFVALHLAHLDVRDGDLLNTCRVMEAPYLEILESEEISKNKKLWAIGPIVSMIRGEIENMSKNQHHSLQWLDKRDPKSVIYVSFGTTTSLTNEQIHELAHGLEQSKASFLWVVRDADKADIFDGKQRRVELPEGFEERVHGVGLVVRDWAPQVEILSHGSVGGFMSHCGWNSCMESITAGVPIAAWPMHSDQPFNATLVADVLKMGVIVRDWSQREGVVEAGRIRDAVRKLMEMEEGAQMRRRAEELAVEVRRATQPGGASRLELDSFIAHITR